MRRTVVLLCRAWGSLFIVLALAAGYFALYLAALSERTNCLVPQGPTASDGGATLPVNVLAVDFDIGVETGGYSQHEFVLNGGSTTTLGVLAPASTTFRVVTRPAYRWDAAWVRRLFGPAHRFDRWRRPSFWAPTTFDKFPTLILLDPFQDE